MLNGMEFQTVGAAYLKALAIIVTVTEIDDIQWKEYEDLTCIRAHRTELLLTHDIKNKIAKMTRKYNSR